MRYVQVGLAVAAALLVQTVGGRYFWPLQRYPDLFLVSAVGFGLVRGRLVGMGTGTVAGLVQDAFSGGMLGLNGLSKTALGYAAGIIGQRLILRGWLARFLFFFLASAADLLILALLGLAVERPIILGEGLAPLAVCGSNGAVGAVLLAVADRHR